MSETPVMSGYASIDKPWLKYYPTDVDKRPLPQETFYTRVYLANKDHPDEYAFNYYGKHITYDMFFREVDRCAKSLLPEK